MAASVKIKRPAQEAIFTGHFSGGGSKIFRLLLGLTNSAVTSPGTTICWAAFGGLGGEKFWLCCWMIFTVWNFQLSLRMPFAEMNSVLTLESHSLGLIENSKYKLCKSVWVFAFAGRFCAFAVLYQLRRNVQEMGALALLGDQGPGPGPVARSDPRGVSKKKREN